MAKSKNERTPFSPATDSDQPEQGDDGSDAPSSDGNTVQDPQARRPAWTPHPGALQHVFGNADTTKIDRYKNLNERRGRK